MINKFEANIVLCETITEDNEFYELFNNIIVGNDQNNKAAFDMGIFLSANIKQKKEEMLLVDVVYLEAEGDYEPVFPIGSITREYIKKGISRELSVFRENEVEFKWEGLYAIEIRQCKEVIDIEDVSIEKIIKVMNEAEVVNTFTFSVEFEK